MHSKLLKLIGFDVGGGSLGLRERERERERESIEVKEDEPIQKDVLIQKDY